MADQELSMVFLYQIRKAKARAEKKGKQIVDKYTRLANKSDDKDKKKQYIQKATHEAKVMHLIVKGYEKIESDLLAQIKKSESASKKK